MGRVGGVICLFIGIGLLGIAAFAIFSYANTVFSSEGLANMLTSPISASPILIITAVAGLAGITFFFVGLALIIKGDPKPSQPVVVYKYRNAPRKTRQKSTRKESYGKDWVHVYSRGKPALKNRRSGKIVFPSNNYVRLHHPQGPWDS